MMICTAYAIERTSVDATRPVAELVFVARKNDQEDDAANQATPALVAEDVAEHGTPLAQV